jgi:hypothetical protein
MKITKQQLKQIIKEEIERVLNEEQQSIDHLLNEVAPGAGWNWGNKVEPRWEEFIEFMVGTPEDPKGLLAAWMKAVEEQSPDPYRVYLSAGDPYEGKQREMWNKFLDQWIEAASDTWNTGEKTQSYQTISPKHGHTLKAWYGDKNYRHPPSGGWSMKGGPGSLVVQYRQTINKLFAHLRQVAEENDLKVNGSLPSDRTILGGLARFFRGY